VADLVAGTGPDWVLHPGGSPSNTAVGLARLDVPTLMLARLAAGPLGVRLRGHLVANGVDLSLAVPAGEPASVAFVDVATDGGASYAFYVQDTADFCWRPGELAPLPEDVIALHTGSLASWLAPGWEQVARAARQARGPGRITVSLDPNLRPALLPDRGTARVRVEQLVRSADLVKASAEDVAWLAPGASIETVARSWLGLAPALIVVTLGEHGSVAFTEGAAPVAVPGSRAAVVDTVGAGDSFSSALLAGLYDRGVLGAGFRAAVPALDLRALLTTAGRAAALTCARAGAQPPTSAELSAP
jgi:fructokinase